MLLKKVKLCFSPKTWHVPSQCIASFFWSGPSLTTVTEIRGPRFGAKKQLFVHKRKLGALCPGILILATGHGFLEYAFPSFGGDAICCWNDRCPIESRGITTTQKAFSCDSPHLAGLGELISLLPKVTHLSSILCYVRVWSAFTCLCFAHVLCVLCLSPLHSQRLHCILHLCSRC